MAGKKKVAPIEEVSANPENLRTWVKPDGTKLELNGYKATIEAAVALGWKPA